MLRLRQFALTLTLPMSLSAGCILPLAPQFQDPNGNENHAPTISMSDPEDGSQVFILPLMSRTFTLTISDRDVNDRLNVRWIRDLPPYSDDMSTRYDQSPERLSNGQPQTVTTTVSCASLSLDRNTHTLTALVADRAFLDDMASDRRSQLIGVSEGGLTAEGHWYVDLRNCSQ